MSSPVLDLSTLRETMTRLERGSASLRQPESSALGRGRVPLGADPLRLDAILGGGLKRGALHEIVAAGARDEAAAAGFAMALAIRAVGEGRLVWIIDDRAALETGMPYRAGLVAQGLDADRLVLVKTRDTATTLWATEEALRAGVSAVITELWRPRAYDLTASRRLLMAARRGGAVSLLLPVGLGRGDGLSSAADTRFSVAAAPSAHQPSAAMRTPVPGPAGFAVRLLKLRGTAANGLRGFDREETHGLLWDRGSQGFRTAAVQEATALSHALDGAA